MKARVLTVLWVTLLFVLIVLGSFVAGRRLGYAEGLGSAKNTCLNQHLASQQAVLTNVTTLTTQAQQASLELNSIIQSRREADEQSTQELRHVLNQSANARSDCLLPAHAMQQLQAARARANHAATSGIGSAMSDTASTR